MTHIVPVTQARKDLLKLVDKVDEEYIRVDVTKNGRVKASIVSPDYKELIIPKNVPPCFTYYSRQSNIWN